MNNIKLSTLILLFVILLTGCAASNIKKDYLLDEKKGMGLLVVSLVRSGEGNFGMFADIQGVNNKYKNSVPVTDLFASSDWDCPMFGEIPKKKPCGRLAVVEMPKGEYEFYAWHGRQGTNFTIESVKKFSKKFNINAGKATYIGSIHFIISRKETGESILGIPVSKPTFDIEIRNMQDRDLSIFYKKHPNIANEKVQIKIIQ